MSQIRRTYPELIRLPTFEERYHYLAIRGVVGESVFGYERELNQMFYRSMEWRNLRRDVVIRDLGCDLGMPGHEIHSRPYVHHMNPMTLDQIVQGNPDILNPDLMITVSFRTHNAIHFGDESQLPQKLVERSPGDTAPWL